MLHLCLSLSLPLSLPSPRLVMLISCYPEWRTIEPFEDINLTLCSGMKSGQPNKKGHWLSWREKQERDKMAHVKYYRKPSQGYILESESISNKQSLEWVTYLPSLPCALASIGGEVCSEDIRATTCADFFPRQFKSALCLKALAPRGDFDCALLSHGVPLVVLCKLT